MFVSGFFYPDGAWRGFDSDLADVLPFNFVEGKFQVSAEVFAVVRQEQITEE